jgi:hypothetical protein
MRPCLILTCTCTLAWLGFAETASGQYYSREDAILDRAEVLRREAADLKDRNMKLQVQNSSTQVLKYQVDDWARRTQQRAADIAKQSNSVDRQKFFTEQAAAVNRAEAAQLQEQGRAIFAAAQQVALRTQALMTFEKELWQWKAMLDQQDAQLKANIDGKNANHDESSAALTKDNQRLDAIMKSNQELREAIKRRREALSAREAELKKREAADLALKTKVLARREKSLAAARDVEELEQAVTEQAASLKKAEESTARAMQPSKP